ncbi:uncharacterized protein PRCAT00000072001 [Priceomyces carsonii]|uniref:uncharacterized protein n=1 Tax=Priceomyces carsonii TaxID=28549 RepID=UPI002EDB9A54|nr:unnamed protein product [Priceomyces carsonii]
MSSNLVEIKSKLWNGTINIKISFMVDKNSDRKEFLFTAYRNSYFPIHFPLIISYFKLFDKHLPYQPIWLEYDSVPIKWNLPIGVLYDYLRLPSDSENRDVENCWNIQLRQSDYPVEHIIPFMYKNEDTTIAYEKSLKELVVNQLKQSCFVLNGTSRPIMNLSEHDSDDLWDSIKYHNLSQNSKINNKIIPAKIHKIPLKIYIQGASNAIQAPVSSQEEGRPVILDSVLKNLLPDLFAGSNIIALVHIHGIHSDSFMGKNGLSIFELWNVFKHLDNFLYVFVILKNDK